MDHGQESKDDKILRPLYCTKNPLNLLYLAQYMAWFCCIRVMISSSMWSQLYWSRNNKTQQFHFKNINAYAIARQYCFARSTFTSTSCLEARQVSWRYWLQQDSLASPSASVIIYHRIPCSTSRNKKVLLYPINTGTQRLHCILLSKQRHIK